MRIDKQRKRFYLAGYRLHHGFTGLAIAIFGAALMLHDWADRFWCPRREQ
mgnify:CR=1 FL=1